MNDLRHWQARQTQGHWEITDGVVRFAVPDSFGTAFGSFDQDADLTEALRLLRELSGDRDTKFRGAGEAYEVWRSIPPWPAVRAFLTAHPEAPS